MNSFFFVEMFVLSLNPPEIVHSRVDKMCIIMRFTKMIVPIMGGACSYIKSFKIVHKLYCRIKN
jgi:hypothetical protein